MSGKYSKSSPYHKTAINNGFLGFYVHRVIPKTDDDVSYVIADKYEHAPDLLASDWFDDGDLWWVFAARNGLEDPVFDLKAGMTLIFPPKDIMNRIA